VVVPPLEVVTVSETGDGMWRVAEPPDGVWTVTEDWLIETVSVVVPPAGVRTWETVGDETIGMVTST
jgi:hypothetical protein